jgi:hypothetical protein
MRVGESIGARGFFPSSREFVISVGPLTVKSNMVAEHQSGDDVFVSSGVDDEEKCAQVWMVDGWR